MSYILFVPTTATADVAGAMAAFQRHTQATSVNPFAQIDTNQIEHALANNQFDNLLEKIYSTAQVDSSSNNNQKGSTPTLVQGFGADKPYSMQVNTDTAHALDAQIVLVCDDNNPTMLAVYAQVLGGQDGRVIGAIAKHASDKFTFPITTNLDDHFIQQLPIKHSTSLSPSAFRVALVNKAQAAKKRIVLPEGDEPRTVEAANICQTRGIAQCILLAKRENVEKVASGLGIRLSSELQIIDPDSIREQYVAPMVERRQGKTDEQAAREQLQDTVVLGTMMLQMGDVDGLVSGAIHTTANTIRPAFQLIKTAPQYSLVSSAFFMLLPEQVLVYADCAVNPNPNAEELAEIAIQTAESARAFGIEPKVAMISYSTGTSGAGVDVDLVAKATEIVRTREPSLAVDGPLQYDAATVPSVGKSKAPNSPVAGCANVFIFPSLSVGNALYKAVQRSANVLSVGPMLQGLNKPVNDLSRGCLMQDIVYTIALTAIQADK